MRISTKAWNEYIRKMSRISNKAADLMTEYIQKHGFENDQELLNFAASLTMQYGEAIGTLSAEMYDKVAAAAGVSVPPAELADIPSFADVARTVHGAKKKSEKLVPGSVGRMVKQVGADTTLKNAKRDGAEWAWIPSGDSCAFCITLASRGWQNAGKNTLKNGHAEHIHANCDCQYAIRFSENDGVAGYDPEEYLRMYNEAEGSPKDKINALRRQFYTVKKAGGITGAYTNANDPEGKKREKSANDFYEQIRNRKPEFEIAAVAKNSGMSESEVDRIFRHVFIREHRFEDGSIKRFDPDYYMQNSWMRLREGKNIQPHDMILLKHELAEEEIMGESLEIIYETAHNEVAKIYDYASALMEYLKDHDA